MNPRRALPRAVPTPNPSVSGPSMGHPRAWLMSEVVVAAKALLTVEREAARARRGARWICQSDISMPATQAVARWFGKGRTWLEALIEVADAVEADPKRFRPALELLDRRAAPLAVRRWIRDVQAGGPAPVPPEGACAPLTVGRWPPSTVAVAARALLRTSSGIADLRPGVLSLASVRGDRKAMTVVARLWGEQADWLSKILDVCEAAEADPDTFGRLVGVMDKAGRPQAAWSRMESIRDEQRVLGLVPNPGRFRTLVFDPPWNEDNLSPAAGHDYAQMSIDEIRALPVGAWAEDDAHLYLWVTNNTLPLAFELIKAWGFEHKSFHTWVKETDALTPKFSLGREFRNTTEHFIFARRGSRKALCRRQATLSLPTHHRWPVGRNSVKPEGFYELVRAASYGPFGEAFQRLERPDFANLFIPAQPASMAAAE